jgi:hypothetical protein
MACPQFVDGDDLQIWKVATNILNRQSWIADRGWPCSLGVGPGGNTLHHKKNLLQNVL